MWLQKAEINLDGAITTLTLGEQWHVLTHLRSLAAIQAGMGVVRRRFPGVTLPGFDFVPFDHYAQVTLTSTEGITWSASKAKPRFKAPRNLSTRKLYKYLDPLILDAVNNPYSVSAPLPVTAAYCPEPMPPFLRWYKGRDWYKEPERFTSLDSSLYPFHMLLEGMHWLTFEQDSNRREAVKRRDFDHQNLPLMLWDSVLERLNLPFKVESLSIHGLVDFMRVMVNNPERGWVSFKLADLPSNIRLVLGFVLDLVRRTVQLNPPERLDDPERGLNTSGVILIRRWDVLKATGYLDEEKLKRIFPNLQFLVTVLDL